MLNNISFFEINLKLIRNGPCLDVLEFFLDGDGTVLRYQNRGVICIFKDAIIGRECLEIHGINQVSRRSYTRTLDYTTSDWEPFGLLTTRNNCLLATCKKTEISNAESEAVWINT